MASTEYRPKNPDGTRGSKYSNEAYEFIRRFIWRPAVAFFSEWQEGHVDCSLQLNVEVVL